MSRAVPTRAAPRARRRRRERGVALIMVLGAIAIMIVMLAEFQDDAGAEFAAATAARDSVQAEYFARSAINLVAPAHRGRADDARGRSRRSSC